MFLAFSPCWIYQPFFPSRFSDFWNTSSLRRLTFEPNSFVAISFVLRQRLTRKDVDVRIVNSRQPSHRPTTFPSTQVTLSTNDTFAFVRNSTYAFLNEKHSESEFVNLCQVTCKLSVSFMKVVCHFWKINT